MATSANIAIIDVGSNNVKLEIHQVEADGQTKMLASDKVKARLGSGVFLTEKLAETNVEIAIQGIIQFKNLIKTHRCKKIVALGTAALRETDSKDFVKRVRRECGVDISVISGREEARIIYFGVLAYTPFEGRTFFLNDIGGGSTEISVSDDNTMFFVESLRLGTVRLKEYFQKELDKQNYPIIENYIKEALAPHLTSIDTSIIEMGLSTGGTAQNLLEMARYQVKKFKRREENGMSILRTSDLRELVEAMKGLSTKELVKFKGLDPDRVDIILPGGLILVNILETLKIEKSLISPRGLRDGALVDFIYNNINKNFYVERQERYRYRVLEGVGKKYKIDLARAEHCSNLALKLFDLLQVEHKLNYEKKDILQAAAFLHEIGMFIDYSQHHKHSYYLVMNTELPGFSNYEKKLIALITRYHRKTFPKASHAEFQVLNNEDKDAVLKLAALVRIVNALDRSHESLVSDILFVSSSSKDIVLEVVAKEELSLEMWSLKRTKHFFETVFKKELVVKQLIQKNSKLKLWK